MNNVNRLRIRHILAWAIAAGLGSAGSATAADFSLDFPAGVACSFDLRIDGIRGGTQNLREFTDENGNIVRTLTIGTGSALTITNLATNAALSRKSNWADTKTTDNSDGSQSVMGDTIVILFPTAVPAGPTTTLYVGEVVYAIDSSGTFTLQGHSGKSTRICEALS